MKLYIFGTAQGFNFFDQLRHGVTHPRNHHGPALNAAQPVNTLFLGAELEQVFKRVAFGLLDQAFNGHAPRLGDQGVGIFGRVRFVGTKFVEIVVGSRVFVVSEFFHCHGTSYA